MKSRKSGVPFVAALIFSVSAALAQDQSQTAQPPNGSAPIQPVNSSLGPGYNKPPAPAARGVSPAYEPQPYDPSQVTPDQNTLAGAEYLGLGSLSPAHSVFDLSLLFSEVGGNYGGSPGQSGLGGQSMVGGSLNFNRTWSRYQLRAIYNGGDSISYGAGNIPSSAYHILSFMQSIEWQRWRLTLHDDFSDSPGATFIGAGLGGPGLAAQYSSLLGAPLNTFGQAFQPSQTIESGYATRYMNSVLGQAQYSLSRRSTFTFAASYGLLDFNQAGYVSSHMLNAQAGYDYQLDAKNSIAVLGGYGKIDYTGTANSTNSYTGSLAYGRKITGRLAFQAAVGPQLISSSGTGANYRQWLVSVNSALTYAWRRSTASFSFARALTSGSGVLQGATSDTFTISASRQLTRSWTGSVNGGYSRNNGLAPSATGTAQFQDWFFGSSIGRQVGRRARVSFSYGLWKSISPSVCPVTSCGVNGLQQTFALTVNWHLRPNGIS